MRPFFFFSSNCNMWDLVPWAGIKSGPPAMGVGSLSHWTTWEVPQKFILNNYSLTLFLKWINEFSTFKILFFFLCYKISPLEFHTLPIGLWIRLRFFLVCDGCDWRKEGMSQSWLSLCAPAGGWGSRGLHSFPERPQTVALVYLCRASCLFLALRSPAYPAAPHGGSVSSSCPLWICCFYLL